MNLRDTLKQRLKNTSDEELEWTLHILDKYRLEVTIRNLVTGKCILKDIKGRTVELQLGTFRNGWTYVERPKADIQILVVDGMLAGWIQSEKLTFMDPEYGIDLAAMIPLPDTFDFSAVCTHLADHGGYYEGEDWICFGCGRKLVFNDLKR